MARNKRKKSTMRRLHRTVGAGAAIFVIFMVLSGLAINHSNGIGLDQRHVSQPLLLDWYGLEGPDHILSYPVAGGWASFAGSQLYLNGVTVTTLSNGVGAVFNGDMLVVAGSDELLLLDAKGNLVERLPWDASGSGMVESVGLNANNMIVVEAAGIHWQAGKKLLKWQQVDDDTLSPLWSSSSTEPENIRKAIAQQYRGEGPSMERLLLDLHSGRFFGSMGIWVYDLLALAVGFLALSGLVLWLRGRRNGKRK